MKIGKILINIAPKFLRKLYIAKKMLLLSFLQHNKSMYKRAEHNRPPIIHIYCIFYKWRFIVDY